jgi:DNA-binding protein YbaB
MTEDIIGTFERTLADLSRQQEDLVERQAKLADARGHGSSKDGRVRIEAAVGGRVTQVRIDPNAMRKMADDLASDIQAAIDAATADAAAKAAEIMGSDLAADDTKAALTGGVLKSLPGPKELREIQSMLDDRLRRINDAL